MEPVQVVRSRQRSGGVGVRMIVSIGVLMLLVTVACYALWGVRLGQGVRRAPVVTMSGARVEVWALTGRGSGKLVLAITRRGESRKGFYPLYYSSTRYLPNCTLVVRINEKTQEVRIDMLRGVGTEALGYVNMEKDLVMTRRGVKPPCDSPWRLDFDGGQTELPEIGSSDEIREVILHIRDKGRRMEVE